VILDRAFSRGYAKTPILDSHRDQAKEMDLEVQDLNDRLYTDLSKKGVRRVVSLGISGRVADVSQLCMFSIRSRKP